MHSSPRTLRHTQVAKVQQKLRLVTRLPALQMNGRKKTEPHEAIPTGP